MHVCVVCFVCVSFLFSSSLGCYQCFIELRMRGDLCMGIAWSKYDFSQGSPCFELTTRIFDTNQRVIEAARVGEGYEPQLREILKAEILSVVNEFAGQWKDETVHEERLQKAADNFIAAASKLPRVSGCFPPCGFQSEGAVYNCDTCQYDTCELPLDCPMKEIEVMEKAKIQMWCAVAFPLPDDIEMIWRFADEVKTQQVQQFVEVTAGVDALYSISSAGFHNQGTYQCEIYSGRRSIVRLYFYLQVTPQVMERHTDLQEIFDLSLLPGGQILPMPDGPPLAMLPSPVLLAACLTSLLLMLFLCLGTLYWLLKADQKSDAAQAEVERISQTEIWEDACSFQLHPAEGSTHEMQIAHHMLDCM